MRETAKELDWHLNYAGIARIWRGGCIIKVRAGHLTGGSWFTHRICRSSPSS
jgi:hypothetical protein